MPNKTLSQVAGSALAPVEMQTSEEITQGKELATGERVVGDSISEDLASIIGSGAKVAQEVDRLKVGVASRSATSRLTELSLGMNAIKKNTEPNAQSQADAQVANEVLYQELGRVTYDNKEAQNKFDSMFHNTGTRAVSNENARLYELEMQNLAEDLAQENKDNAMVLASNGMLSKQEAQTLIEQSTASGRIDEEGYKKDILDIQLDVFKTNASNKNYSTDGGIFVQEDFDKTFMGTFTDWAYFDEDGAIVYKTDDVEMNQKIQAQYDASMSSAQREAGVVKSDYESNAWEFANAITSTGAGYTDGDENGNFKTKYQFITDPKEFETRINEQYPELDKAMKTKIMNMFRRKNTKTENTNVSIANWQIEDSRINTKLNSGAIPNKDAFEAHMAHRLALLKNPNLSDGKRDTLKKQMAATSRAYMSVVDATNSVNKSIKLNTTNESLQEVHGQIINGIGHDDYTTLGADVKKQVKRKVTQFESILQRTPLGTHIINPDFPKSQQKTGDQVFAETLELMNSTYTALGEKPNQFITYDKVYTDTSYEYESVDEAKKAIGYINWQISSGNKAYTFAITQTNRLYASLNKVYKGIDGEDLSGSKLDDARLEAFRAERRAFGTSDDAKQRNREMRTAFFSYQDELAEGSMEILSFTDANLAKSTVSASYQKAMHTLDSTMGKQEVETFLEDQQYLNLTTLGQTLNPFARNQRRIPLPDGADAVVYENAIDEVMSKNGYSVEDVEFETRFDMTTKINGAHINDYVTILKTKEGSILGYVYPDATYILNSKQGLRQAEDKIIYDSQFGLTQPSNSLTF